jgi:hypothetical protein
MSAQLDVEFAVAWLFTAIKKLTLREVAHAYAMVMVFSALAGVQVDWKPIHQAILDKWSHSGLAYIRKRAWKESIL